MSNFDDNPYAAGNFTDNDYGHVNEPAPHVPDYLIPSIVLAFFCQPLGIAAIVFAALASSEKGNRNYAKALSHAKNAKICLIIGVAGVIGIGLIYLFVIIMMIASGAAGAL